MYLDCVAPWDILSVVCDWTFPKFSLVLVIQREFPELEKKYEGRTHFYTDRAKTSSFVGSAVHSNQFASVKRRHICASIFTAELYAISVAIDNILRAKKKRAVLFVDSQSAIIAICSLNVTAVQQLTNTLNDAMHGGLKIKFCWVPSHMGMKGN